MTIAALILALLLFIRSKTTAKPDINGQIANLDADVKIQYDKLLDPNRSEL